MLVRTRADMAEKRDAFIKKFHDYQRKAEMYYVYHWIQRFTVRYHICFVFF